MKEFVKRLIGRLEEERAKGIYDSDNVITVKDAYRKSIKIVNQLAEEYKEKDCSKCSRRSWYQKGYADAEKNNGWIPCSERLPEANQKVLTCDKDGWISVNVNMPYIGVRNDFECGYYVAWQPLPAPFKKGSEQMGRLVDIDEVIRVAENTFPQEDVRKIAWVLCYTPTAYDVEKVEKELIKEMNIANYDQHNVKGGAIAHGKYMAYKNSIDIVKRGGIDGKI